MPAFKIILLASFLISLALGSKCPQEAISKLVVCYYQKATSLDELNICNCTHLVFASGVSRDENNSISASEDTLKLLQVLKEKKEHLPALFTLEAKPEETSMILKSENRSEQLLKGIAEFLEESKFDGVELNFQFNSEDGVPKESYASFVKNLSKTLTSKPRRVKREGYDVFEKVQDDVTTASYTTQTPKNSTSKTQSIKQGNRKSKESNRKVREDKEEDLDKNVDYATLEEAINAKFSEENSKNHIENVYEKTVFVRLSIKPEIIAKKYDLKGLSRYSDILIVPTHDIVNSDEDHLTYHPSRLMGLSDILNTDSILDFLTGMGAVKSKMVISLPATVLKFQLKDENKNTPRSPSRSKPQVIDQSQLCSLFSKNNWTIERDDDLTAPYAFSGKTWLAFEDEISVNIKGKYILLRELAGGAIYPIDADLNDGSCTKHTGSGYLSGVLHKNFESLERKPRALVLESLQEEIHDTAFASAEAGVKLSEFRIVRVVDHSGAVHVIRKNTKTQFKCSRQGYFSHPLGCNKFYRCVKFDQYSDEFTVFEYDCPAGLAFDERWEVCVWPGSLPHGAPCTGSSEIAPVPRSHYQCPNHEGYYADPENCRWFFACLDHARDGITPLTAYEFRCPFGLVFSEERLACDWPWLVGSCGNRGAAGYLQVSAGGQTQGFHSSTFINGGNLEASLGQYGSTEQESSFIGFGKKFGNGLKGTSSFNSQGTYQGAQSAGFGYIANQFEEGPDRAPFATFPEYEISGGRIYNKGGVVLDQNIAGISGAAAVGGLGKLNVGGGASRTLGAGADYLHQENNQFGSGIQSTSNFKFEKLKPALSINTLDISSGGQASFQDFVTTPKPFVVDIPSVQINSEKHSEFSGHSTFGSSTPQTLIFKETPRPENHIHLTGKAVSTSQGFTATQPTFSLGILGGTPTAETHVFGQVVSDEQKAPQFNPPSISFVSSPRPQTHRFEQNQYSKKDFTNQPVITAGTPIVTGTESYKYTSHFSSRKSEETPIAVVTPKPGVASLGLVTGGSSAPTESSFGTYTQFNHKFSDHGVSKADFEKPIAVGIPAVQKQIVGEGFISENIAVGQNGVSYGTPAVTAAPSVYLSGAKSPAAFSSSTSAFSRSSLDDKVLNELRFKSPQSSFAFPAVTSRPEFSTFSKPTSDKYSGLLNTVSSKIPLETHKPDFQIFSNSGFNGVTGKSESVVSFGVPAVTPQPNLNSLKFHEQPSSTAGVTPIVPFDYSAVTGQVKNNFVQSEIPKGFSPAVPSIWQHSFEQSSHQQKGISEGGKTTYGIPLQPSGIKSQGTVQSGGVSQTLVQPVPEIILSQSPASTQPAFGQRYSYSSSFKQSGNHFGVIKPFENVSTAQKPAVVTKTEVAVPKIQQSNVLPQVSIDQQPIITVGTITSSGVSQTFSTPSTLRDVFSQNPEINFKSGFGQGQPLAVTTPASVVPLTPSTPVSFDVNQLSVNVFGKSEIHSQQEKNSLGISGPTLQQVNAPGDALFLQKSSDFKQEIKSFSPSPQVTSSIPLTYNQDIRSGFGANSGFYQQTNVHFPPVTHKTEVIGSAAEFGTSGKSQISFQKEQPTQIDFFKTRAFEEKKTEFAPIQVTTAVPEYRRPAVTTTKPFTPREELVELEISKSIEINPIGISQSGGGSLLSRPVEIQQQPLHLISQKTYPVKQVIQPFYDQPQKEILQVQVNNRYQGQSIYQQQVTRPAVVEQKQYLPPSITPKSQPPTVSYTTAKTVFEQTSALPVFEASRIPLTLQKETVSANAVPNHQNENRRPLNAVPSKVSLLLPSVTELPRYTSQQDEELTVQTHRNFQSQKINKFGNGPVQNVFIQPEVHSTLKPTFETSGHFVKFNRAQNLTTGTASGIKYSINPNIAIPEPPKEYILAQNTYSTIRPEVVTTGSGVQSTESFRGGFKASTYLPPASSPPAGKSSKTTIISVGNVNKDNPDAYLEQILDKYSGRFGQVINGKSDEVVTKVIKGDERGKIEFDRRGSSTVQYEVSSTSRPRSRGRQYHGGITSGVQATNKYEEYEIDRESQRSYNGKGGEGNSDGSKTTIDLKNLKLEKDKKTVIVVSQVSDANPVLIGKLAGQCSCQSNMIELRGKGKKTKSSLRRKNKISQNQQQQSTIINEYLPPYEDGQQNSAVQTLAQGEVSTSAPETVAIGGSIPLSHGVSYSSETNFLSSSTTALPDVVSSTILSSLGPDGVLSITPKAIHSDDRLRNKKKQFRGRARYLPPVSVISEDGSPVSLLSPVPASEIASTIDYSLLKGDESRTQNEIDGGSAKILAGAAFDRYGPGGWRSFDETLQGSIDCKRPGLFRHPKYCNKFYACNYDPWKERFTLHVFNCPIHLTYDSSISACNWPVRGPACADDNLLV